MVRLAPCGAGRTRVALLYCNPSRSLLHGDAPWRELYPEVPQAGPGKDIVPLSSRTRMQAAPRPSRTGTIGRTRPPRSDLAAIHFKIISRNSKHRLPDAGDPRVISRRLVGLLLRSLGAFPVVVITGPRQSGKSTLLRQCLPQARWVSLEDPDLRAFAVDVPRGFLDRFAAPLVIDEVRNVPDCCRTCRPGSTPAVAWATTCSAARIASNGSPG